MAKILNANRYAHSEVSVITKEYGLEVFLLMNAGANFTDVPYSVLLQWRGSTAVLCFTVFWCCRREEAIKKKKPWWPDFIEQADRQVEV